MPRQCHNRIEQQARNRHMVRCFQKNRSSKIHVYTIVSPKFAELMKVPHALPVKCSYSVFACPFVRSLVRLIVRLFVRSFVQHQHHHRHCCCCCFSILSILYYSFLLIFRWLLISCAKARIFDTMNLTVCVSVCALNALTVFPTAYAAIETICCNRITKPNENKKFEKRVREKPPYIHVLSTIMARQ